VSAYEAKRCIAEPLKQNKLPYLVVAGGGGGGQRSQGFGAAVVVLAVSVAQKTQLVVVVL
jgi:hypothetical protein